MSKNKNKTNVSGRFRKIEINHQKDKNRARKEYTKIILLAVFLLTIICGTSYALFSISFNSKKEVEVTAGTFKIDFEEGNVVSLQNAAPMNDQAGLQTTPYTFTVHNTGTLDAKYYISLEEEDNGENALDRKYVKYSLKEGNGEWSTPALLSNGLILTSNKILTSGNQETFQFKIWLDESAPNEVQGKKYGAKIVVNAVQTNANLENISVPIININGNSNINIIEGSEFIDPGISNIKDSNGNPMDSSNATIRYEYFDGENTIDVDTIDTAKVGIYYIYYEVKDKNGNVVGTTVRVVNVYHKDQTPPTISLLGDEVITLKYGEAYQENGAIAQDNEYGDLTDKIIVFGTVNSKKDGIYLIKYFVLDKEGNISSVTRTVIVEKETGRLDVDVNQNEEDSTKVEVDVSTETDAKEVKFVVTRENKKPADKEFKTLEELEKDGIVVDGKFIFTENGTYYIWIKDSNGNITKKKIVVNSIDKTVPECEFITPDYIGLELNTDIILKCTDPVDIQKKYLTDTMFELTGDAFTIVGVSAPEKIDLGYQYYITLRGVQASSGKIVLPKGMIQDRASNKNVRTESSTVKVSELVLEENNVTIDMGNDETYQIKASGTNMGKLIYTSNDSSIAMVSEDGLVTGIKPGATTITVKELNGGATATLKINVEKTVTASFKMNGLGVTSIEKEEATCKLTKDNPDSCIITGPSIEVDDGYKAIGWSTDSTSHTGSYELSLTENTKFYSISKKNEILLTALFNANGSSFAEEDSNVSRSCILDEVYNNEVQKESCRVSVPTIETSTNTPIFLGFQENKPEYITDELELKNGELTLTEKNSNHTWYAISKSEEKIYEIDYTMVGKEYGVEKIGKEHDSCTIPSSYNGNPQNPSCTVTAPSIKTHNGYSPIGWNQDASASDGILPGDTISLTSETTSPYYPIVEKGAVTYTVTFVKSGVGVDSISSTAASCTIPATNGDAQGESCTVSLPEIGTTDLYQALGWSQNSDARVEAGEDDPYATTGYVALGNKIAIHDSNTVLYSISKKDALELNAIFDGNGASLNGNTELSCTLKEVYNGEEREDSCTFNSPSIVRENFDIIGWNTDSSAHTSDASYDNASSSLTIDSSNNNQTWYAITKRDLSTKFHVNGASSISSEEESCTIWNSDTNCNITMPNIVREGFNIVGWNTNQDATDTSDNMIAIGQEISIVDSLEYYAITKKDVTITYYLNGAQGQTNEFGKIVDTDVTRSCSILNQNEDCEVIAPSISASYNTPQVIGYSKSKDGMSSDWDVYTSKKVTDDKEYYAITKKDAVSYSITYHKQGLGVTSIERTSDSCTINATYNGAKQPSSCEVSSLPSMSMIDDTYTALGWSQNSDATKQAISSDISAENGYIASGNAISIGHDMDLYAISKKNTVTLAATFDPNGAESQTYSNNGTIDTSKEVIKLTCELEEAYNDHRQETSCEVISPIINASINTPEVIGYALDSHATIKDLDPNVKLVLTGDITYYAITKKSGVTYTANWDGNHSTLSSTNSSSCTIKATYNGEKQDESCTVSAPDVTPHSYTPKFVGFSIDYNGTTNDSAYDTDNKELTLTDNNTDQIWYAITMKDAVVYNVNYAIGAHVSAISKNSGSCTIPAIYNGNNDQKQTTTCIIGEDDTDNNPVITPDKGYSSLGWSQLNGTTVGSPVVVLTEDNMTFYANASANNYTIEFYTDGHIHSTMSATYDKSFSLTTIEDMGLTKRGYTFKYWSSNGVDYEDGAKINQNLASEQGATVRFDAVWADEEKPICRFVSVGNTTTQNDTMVRLECTDTGSGVSPSTLTASDFSVSDTTIGKVMTVSNPTAVTDGYYYDVTVRGLSVGTFDVTLLSNIVTDIEGNKADSVTTLTPVNVTGRIYHVSYTAGDYVTGIGSTEGSCTTTGSNITCSVVLPSIEASTGYTVDGWQDSSSISKVGSEYELNEINTGLILTAVASDQTPPTCTISENPTNWAQSTVLTVTGSDDGSGLADDAYSWISDATGFGTSATRTVTANGTYTAYVKDKAGNVGSCSKKIEKIDTTAPSCAFSAPTDTTIVEGNESTLTLNCTDNDSKITDGSRKLTVSDFTVSSYTDGTSNNVSITSVSEPTTISNGYSYTIKFIGNAYGEFAINLMDGVISDSAGNVNELSTSDHMIAYNNALEGSCSNDLVYNGEQQSLVSGGRGITYSNEKQINAGDYTVTMNSTSQYKFTDGSDSKTISCSIAARKVTFTAASGEKDYDGEVLSSKNATVTSGSLVASHSALFEFDPSTELVDVTNGSVPNKITNVTINSGNTDVTSNYDITTVDGTLKITKADSINPILTGYSGIYDGDSHSFTVSGGSGGTIKYSTDQVNWTTTKPSYINSGSYTVYVKVFGDSNHNDSDVISTTVIISKASTSISFSSKGGSYNGSAIGVTASGTGTLTYDYYMDSSCTTKTTTSVGAASSGAAPVDAGTYYVKVTSSGDSNYNGSTSECTSFDISKKTVAVTWGTTTSFVVTGNALAPTATASSGVSGETLNITRTTATTVGTHTSTATLSSVTGGRAKTTNYTLTNTTMNFSITAITRQATFNTNHNTLSTPTGCSGIGTANNQVRQCTCTTTGSSTSCDINVPSVSNTITTSTCGYSTSATGTKNCILTNETKTLTLSEGTNTTYYAQTYKDESLSVKFTTDDSSVGVATVTGTVDASCDLPTAYNAQSATVLPSACTTTLTAPVIVPTTGNKVLGWYSNSGTSIASGAQYTITRDIAGRSPYYARAQLWAAGVTYTDTYSMGCTTVQCAIDKINEMLD